MQLPLFSQLQTFPKHFFAIEILLVAKGFSLQERRA